MGSTSLGSTVANTGYGRLWINRVHSTQYTVIADFKIVQHAGRTVQQPPRLHPRLTRARPSHELNRPAAVTSGNLGISQN